MKLLKTMPLGFIGRYRARLLGDQPLPQKHQTGMAYTACVSQQYALKLMRQMVAVLRSVWDKSVQSCATEEREGEGGQEKPSAEFSASVYTYMHAMSQKKRSR